MTWYSSLGIVKLSRTSLGLWALAGAASPGLAALAAGFAFFAAGGAAAASATVAAASAVSAGLLTRFGMRLACRGLGVRAIGNPVRVNGLYSLYL